MNKSFKCYECDKSILGQFDQLLKAWLPVSKYWKGSPNRVDKAYCSALCGLVNYNRRVTAGGV